MNDTATSAKPTVYPPADPSPSFPKLEEAIARLVGEGAASSSARSTGGARRARREFVFYDGPPFANGLPHYGHLRHRLRQGPRAALPDHARQAWSSAASAGTATACRPSSSPRRSSSSPGRRDILEIRHRHASTSTAARSCMQFRKEWEYYVNRSARWVDFDNDYSTMDLSYMESVMWAFKQLWDKGLVYEGYRVVPYSWAAQTPLSNFETRLDNCYATAPGPGADGRLPAPPEAGEAAAPKLLAWTTTPWTLPSNLALAVHPEARLRADRRSDGERLDPRRGASRERYASGARRASPRSAASRAPSWSGRTYEPLFPYLRRSTPNAFPRPRRRLRRARRRHRHRPYRAGLRRGRHRRRASAAGIPVVDPSTTGQLHRRGAAYAGQERLRGATRTSSATSRRRAQVVRHETYRPQLSALLAHRRAADLQGDRRPGTWRSADFKDRMVELNQGISWVPGARPRRRLRQLARERARLEHRPQPLLGRADPGVEVATIRPTRASMSTARSTSSSAISASRPKDLHRPYDRRARRVRTPTIRPASR